MFQLLSTLSKLSFQFHYFDASNTNTPLNPQSLANMAGTRSSARQNGDSSSPATKDSAGTKRKAEETSPSSAKKRGRPAKAAKEQKTLEETLPGAGADDESAKAPDTEMKDAREPEKDADAGASGNGETFRGNSASNCANALQPRMARGRLRLQKPRALRRRRRLPKMK